MPFGMALRQPSLKLRFDGFEGIHLVADVWGADGDWPVLLMHGGGQTRHAWGNTAEVLARRGWRAVSLDLRGHGDSEWALNGDYSFTTYAADVFVGPGKFAHFGAAGPLSWQALARSSYGIYWVLVFLAVVNSTIANANAGAGAKRSTFNGAQQPTPHPPR